MRYISLYLLTIPVFFIIDMLWIAGIAWSWYQAKLAAFLGPVNWYAAGLFYFIYIAGIILFAVLPALEAQSLARAALLGAALGLVAYATYDLTNLATLKNWPLVVTIVDLMWGMVLTASVASVSYLIGRWLSL